MIYQKVLKANQDKDLNTAQAVLKGIQENTSKSVYYVRSPLLPETRMNNLIVELHDAIADSGLHADPKVLNLIQRALNHSEHMVKRAELNKAIGK